MTNEHIRKGAKHMLIILISTALISLFISYYLHNIGLAVATMVFGAVISMIILVLFAIQDLLTAIEEDEKSTRVKRK